MINIVDEIFRRCDPAATALLSDQYALTFGELESLVSAATGALESTKLSCADHEGPLLIGLHCPNGIEHIVWSLAIMRHGAVLVAIAPELSHHERDELIKTIGVRFVLCPGGNTWHAKELPLQDIVVGNWRASLVTQANPHEIPYSRNDFSGLNPALIRFSSGTTGHSKGVVLSHDTLLERATACNAQLRIGPDDKVVWTLPMAHHFAASICLYLLHGATTILTSGQTPRDLQQAFITYGGTVTYGAPYHHAILASHPEASRIPTLRLAVSTAAPLREDDAANFQARFGIPLTQSMGIIELGLPLINTSHAHDKPCSVGRPQPGFECRIIDTMGNTTPPFEPGELLLRGPGCFDAYLSPWAPRRTVMPDDWFATGDIAQVDLDGDITLLGRLRAVINVGGLKVFPEEVEAILVGHPTVAEARVYGIAHALYGSIPAADIVPTDASMLPNPQELDQLCRTTLAAHKIPRRINIVDSLPKTYNGKIRRY